MLICTASATAGQEIRYFERNGITYREVLGNPASAQVLQGPQCPQVVYRPQVCVGSQQVVRSYWTPVTEYRWEMRWVNRWNPFAEPYQELRYVPVTRWECRTEVVEMPVTWQPWVADPVPGGGGAYAAGVSPNSSMVAVAGLPSTYAPRTGFQSESTGNAAPAPRLAANGDAASVGAWGPASAPAVAWRLPIRPPSDPPSARMVPVQSPDLHEQLGGIRRFEEEPLRFGR